MSHKSLLITKFLKQVSDMNVRYAPVLSRLASANSANGPICFSLSGL